MVTGPRERLAHCWPEKDRNSPCALPFVSDSGNWENPLSDSLLNGDGGWTSLPIHLPLYTQQQFQASG